MQTIGATEVEILGLEARYGVVLPSDFRDYLRNLCPANDQMDECHTEWWSMARIRSITEEYEAAISDETIALMADRSLFFADGFIWCWAWAICCAPENYGRVALISSADRWVADSFSEFVDRYITSGPKAVS